MDVSTIARLKTALHVKYGMSLFLSSFIHKAHFRCICTVVNNSNNNNSNNNNNNVQLFCNRANAVHRAS